MEKQKESKNSKKNDIGASEEMEEEKKQKGDNLLDLNRVTGSLSNLCLILFKTKTYLKFFLTNHLKKNQTVSFKDCNYVFTISDDKIYGIKRTNEE